MTYRATIGCSREVAARLDSSDELFPGSIDPPVVVADEPDPDRPDEWMLRIYSARPLSERELGVILKLGQGELRIERLAEDDWVAMSQAGLEPIRAGRFFVHTPTHEPQAGLVNFEIDAGLAFGTGHHQTTAGCLAALDRLEVEGRRFANIADIGTGTGLLAFAALALWPEARCIATDIDPISIDVTRDNAGINGVALGHGPGELLLTVADGMDSPLIAARAPFDLIVANILAGPLIELAPAFAAATAPGGAIILAGLLDGQAEAVASAYHAQHFRLADRGAGEWPVLRLTA